jgi:hypothetical protein
MKAESWSFLINHARVLLCIASDPGVRLRDAWRPDLGGRANGLLPALLRLSRFARSRRVSCTNPCPVPGSSVRGSCTSRRRERAFTLAGRPGWRLGSQRRPADGDAAGRVR